MLPGPGQGQDDYQSDLVDNVQDIHPRDKRSGKQTSANLALDDTYHIYGRPLKLRS